MLKRQGKITAWHDRRIGAGQEVHNQIDEHLERADIILLLLSADFLASDYCYDTEMQRAMERHEQGTARVISVILRPCGWKGAPLYEALCVKLLVATLLLALIRAVPRLGCFDGNRR